MKRGSKVLGILIVGVVVVVVAVQFFLNRALNPMVQKALPQVSESLGLEVGVDAVSLNLFAGALGVDAIRVSNPPGFKEPHVLTIDDTSLDVGMLALLRGIVEVSDAAVEDAVLMVVRNQAGEVNLAGLQAPEVDREGRKKPRKRPDDPPSDAPEDKPDDGPGEPAPDVEAPAEMPRVRVKALAFNSRFAFVDHKTSSGEAPHRVDLELGVDARNVTTFEASQDTAPGTIHISGHLRQNPELFKTDMTVQLAPLVDPQHAGFTANGSIMAIDIRELGALAEETGVSGETADLAVALTVSDGTFSPGSKLEATLRNPKLVGELKRKHQHVTLPETVTFTVPVSGTLKKPVIRLDQAITVSLLRNLADNPELVLDNVTIDGKSLRERLRKALGGKSGKTDTADIEKAGKAVESTINEGLKQLGDLFE